MDQGKLVLAWLLDAHALEETLTHVLEMHARTARHDPRLRSKLDEHLEQTKRHAALVQSCLERLGSHEAPRGSLPNPLAGTLSGPIQEGALIEHAIADYAAEHFEIATYKALAIAARESNDLETARVCTTIQGEEEEMADWLAAYLPQIARSAVRPLINEHAPA